MLSALAHKTAIAGGVRYLDLLDQCDPDGGIDSLKRLDRLLMWVRRDLATQGLGESAIKAPDLRNFVLMVAFVVGQVLRHEYPSAAWLGAETLVAHYPKVNTKSFFQLMALCDHADVAQCQHPPLFVLQIIAARLFGSLDKQFLSPVDGTPMSDSLHRGVLAWRQGRTPQTDMDTRALPSDSARASVPQTNLLQTQHLKGAEQSHNTKPITEQVPKNDAQYAAPTPTPSAVSAATPDTTPNSIPSITPNMSPSTVPTSASVETPSVQTLHTQAAPATKKSSHTAGDKYGKIFDEVKSDLGLLPAVNNSYQDDYLKAATALDKVQAYMNLQMQMQDIPMDRVIMSDKASITLNGALKLLFNTAKSGNTNAMLRLALCYFEGFGVPADPQKGVSLVQRAAEQNDNRAQKLLSKLYYQGVGVTQNIQLGEMWLGKAAAAGHPEAKKIQVYINQVQLMKETNQAEVKKDKLFLVMLGMAAVLLLFTLWISVKYLS